MAIVLFVRKFGLCLMLQLLFNGIVAASSCDNISQIEYDALQEMFMTMGGYEWTWNRALPLDSRWSFPVSALIQASKAQII